MAESMKCRSLISLRRYRWSGVSSVTEIRREFVRDKEKVFDMNWRPENKSATDIDYGKSLLVKYKIQGPQVLTSCSTCHR